MPISQETPTIYILDISVKIIDLRLQPQLSWANEAMFDYIFVVYFLIL